MNKIIPKKGAWVFVNQIVNTVDPVHRFALYYAIPTGKYFYKDEYTVNSINSFAFNEHPYTGDSFDRLINILGGSYDKPNREYYKQVLVNWKKNPHFNLTPKQKEQLKLEDKYDSLEESYPVEAQVKILTEHGDVCLQPYEYNICTEEKVKEYMDCVKEGHAFINYLSDSKQLKGKIADQVFYLRSRGIKYSDALTMCIGSVATRNLFYVYMHPAYVNYFTREKQCSWYFSKHLYALKKGKQVSLFEKYFKQILEIEGWSNFKPDLERVEESLVEYA